jgi:hypothetical protein
VKESDSSQDLSLTYWQATIAFGEEAVDAVVRSPAFARRYPELSKRLESEDQLEVSHTELPGEVVYEIAGRSECLYDFYADNSGIRLFPAMRGQELVWGFPVFGAMRLPIQEALLEYGAFCLFDAVDVGPGYRKGIEPLKLGKEERTGLPEVESRPIPVSEPGDRVVVDPLIKQPIDAFTPKMYKEFLEHFGRVTQEYAELSELCRQILDSEEGGWEQLQAAWQQGMSYDDLMQSKHPELERQEVLHTQITLYQQGYHERLPIHLLAQCPYCGSSVLQPMDSFSLMGFHPSLRVDRLYWGKDWEGGFPPRQRCRHALFAIVSVNLHGLTPDDLPEWAVQEEWEQILRSDPRVTVWPLIARQTSAVVHALPVGRLDDPEPIHRYTAYFVTYFAGDESNLYADEMWVPNDIGYPATGGVQIDPDLLKWVRAGRLYWMDPEDTIRLVKGPEEAFPYANIQPQGWYRIAEGGQVDGPKPYASVWQGEAPAHDESFPKTIEYDWDQIKQKRHVWRPVGWQPGDEK